MAEGKQIIVGSGAAEDAAVFVERLFEEQRRARPFSLEERCGKYLQRCAARIRAGEFPEARILEVKAAIRDLANTIKESDCIGRANVDFYNQQIGGLELQLTMLKRPKAEPSERERMALPISKVWKGGGPELDELFAAMRPDEKVIRFDWQEAVLAGPQGERHLSRKGLRLRSRPSYSTVSVEDWILRNGGPIRAPEDGLSA